MWLATLWSATFFAYLSFFFLLTSVREISLDSIQATEPRAREDLLQCKCHLYLVIYPQLRYFEEVAEILSIYQPSLQFGHRKELFEPILAMVKNFDRSVLHVWMSLVKCRKEWTFLAFTKSSSHHWCDLTQIFALTFDQDFFYFYSFVSIQLCWKHNGALRYKLHLFWDQHL